MENIFILFLTETVMNSYKIFVSISKEIQEMYVYPYETLQKYRLHMYRSSFPGPFVTLIVPKTILISTCPST